MPLLQFFSIAGAALLALLFVADAYLPKPVQRSEPQRSYTIRIAAERNGQEAITFSGHPVRFVPAEEAVADASPAASSPQAPERSPRDAMAQLTPASSVPAGEAARPAKRKPVKRRVRTPEPHAPAAVAGWSRPTHMVGFFSFN